MGVKNYLIEGVSCAGKTTVCDELLRRGYQAVHGDRELAYRGNPKTGEPTEGDVPGEHIWDINKLKTLAADQRHEATFFCGGSRNSHRFIDLFDMVFILQVDRDTLNQRLADRPKDGWGGAVSEGEAFARLQHETKVSLPGNGIAIDSTAPLKSVVDTILEITG